MTSALSERPSAGHKIRVLTAKGLEESPPAALSTALCALDQPQCPVTWIHAEHDEAVVKALDDMGLDEIAVKSLRDARNDRV